ncbi:MAG TPA: hypothetical protein PKE30_01265 [Niabella sp.]|nr:hypothetical protein [Niabella sp.]
MDKIISVDSNIFIWGIRGVSSPSQTSYIQQAKNFFTWVDSNKWGILLPAPMLSEILSPVPPQDHQSILSLIDSRFIVAPFDVAASHKCAELLNRSFRQPDLIQYRLDNAVPKQKMKYDCMIASICITRRIHILYSNDPDMKKFADGQIDVRSLPNRPPQAIQTDLF